MKNNAPTLITWVEMFSVVQQIADQIKPKASLYNYVIAVSKGALIPASLLAHRLNIEEVLVSNKHSDPFDQLPKENLNLLIVDDKLNTGKTMAAVLEASNAWIKENNLEVNIDIVTVFTRRHNRCYGVYLNNEVIMPYEIDWQVPQQLSLWDRVKKTFRIGL